MKRVVVIGSGNVASAFASELSASDKYELVQLYGRNKNALREIADRVKTRYSTTSLAPADFYILAVSDEAIGELSSTLDFGDAVVVHTSGSVPLAGLAPSIKCRGVIYPLQTLSKQSPQPFKYVPMLVEASDDATMTRVKRLATSLSIFVVEVDSARRFDLHVAAVFVSNFVNYMYIQAERLINHMNFGKGMNFQILLPLIARTAEKITEGGAPSQMQTGPAVRGDMETIRRHLERLEEFPEMKELYEMMTGRILQEYSRKKADPKK